MLHTFLIFVAGIWLCSCRNPAGGTDSLPGDTDHEERETGHGDTCAPEDTAAPPDPPIADLDPYVEPAVLIEPAIPVSGQVVTVTYRGSLATSDDLIMRHGFNAWFPDEETEDQTYETLYGQDYYYHDIAMTEAEEGVWTASLTLPEDARSLHMVFGSIMGEEEQWDDRDGLHYGVSTQFPYIGPYLISRTESSASSTMMVSWETWLPCLGVVAWGYDDDLGQWTVGQDLDTLHHVAIPDLEPGVPLYYRVYDAAGNRSPIYATNTAPSPASSFKWIAMSDMQEDPEGKWGEVANEVNTNHWDADLLLMAGDLTAADHPGSWWLFFDRARDLFASVPLAPAPGNHDTPWAGSNTRTESFQRYFPVNTTDEEVWYALDHGPVRFISLVSEDPTSMQEDGAQYTFLAEQLADCTLSAACSWVFVAWHKPPYDAGRRHDAEQEQYRPITALLDGAADWHISGHEHFYQRMLPLRYNAQVAASGTHGRGADQGVGYLLLPPAGNTPSGNLTEVDGEYSALRALLAYPEITDESTSTGSEIGFVVLDGDGDDLAITAWGMGSRVAPLDPHVVDTYAYTRALQ